MAIITPSNCLKGMQQEQLHAAKIMKFWTLPLKMNGDNHPV